MFPMVLTIFAAVTISTGADWMPVRFDRRTLPGSPLDLSGLVDAPAGKRGFVRAGADGHLVFSADGSRVRFFGGNFAWDSFRLDQVEADQVADEVVRMGWNWVRLHGYDAALTRKKGGSTDLDPEALDRFDYFISAMKRRGVYVTLDCYAQRQFSADDGELAAYAAHRRMMKPLLPVSRAAMENWKAFVRRVLEHVNPHTGLALKDDPVMPLLVLVNEGCYYRQRLERYPELAKQLDALGEIGLRKAWREVNREQQAFVRDEIGVKCPVSSWDAGLTPADMALRADFDCVDVHGYFSHPNYFAANGEIYPHSRWSSLMYSAYGGVWRELSWSRRWGVPAVCTEFRHCPPNLFRCESGPVTGAYAAYQDWDAFAVYGYAEGLSSLRSRHDMCNPFDTVNDPLALFSARLSALLFLRGDVRPAGRRVACVLPEDTLERTDVPAVFCNDSLRLALVAAVGHSFGKAPVGMEALPATPGWATNAVSGLRDDRLVSDTGEIVMDDIAGRLSVITPRSECLTLNRGSLGGKFLSVAGVDGPTTVSCHSLDGKDLAQSASVLVFHLTDTSNSGAKYADASRRREFGRGREPVLAHIRRAEVRFAGAQSLELHALGCDGADLGTVGPTPSGSFALSTDIRPGAVFAYHLKIKERKEP